MIECKLYYDFSDKSLKEVSALALLLDEVIEGVSQKYKLNQEILSGVDDSFRPNSFYVFFNRGVQTPEIFGDYFKLTNLNLNIPDLLEASEFTYKIIEESLKNFGKKTKIPWYHFTIVSEREIVNIKS